MSKIIKYKNQKAGVYLADTDYNSDDIRIKTKEITLKDPILIEGFPGIGLVGNIASQHLIEELDMEYIGAMDSRFFPAIAVLYKGLVNMPVRIYTSEDHNIVLVISDIPISHSVAYDISNALLDWAESINVKEVVSIAGISVFEDERKVFGAATNEKMLERINEYAEIFQMGTISGISGNIMADCLARGIPGISLLGAVVSQNPDPRAASEVIKVLNKIYGLSVNTERLVKQAETIEMEMQTLADDVQKSEQQTKTRKEFPSMYG